VKVIQPVAKPVVIIPEVKVVAENFDWQIVQNISQYDYATSSLDYQKTVNSKGELIA
jgi:hypothetical protein